MKRRLLPVIALYGFSMAALATDPKASFLIFSGSGEDDRYVNLYEFNRIYFEQDRMMLTGSDAESGSLEILYSDFNKFRVESTPLSGESLIEVSHFDFTYDSATHELGILAEEDVLFVVSVYDVAGYEVLRHEMKGGDKRRLDGLDSGTFIVIAVGSGGRHVIKLKI